MEEEMQQVKTPSILPDASGHVQKFIDFMVKDEKTGACYRAYHLLRDHCKDKLEKDLAISSEDAAELKHILDDLSAEQLGAKIKEYGIVAPDTKNPLSDPYPFNLMFETTTGMGPGYMCPETAHGIFVGFKDWYSYNHNKLPFAVAQVGPVYKNEISPSQKLLRLCEFTIAEIEHFVDPKDKSHPKFSTVSNLEFLMLPRAEQMTSQSANRLCLDDAVAKGIINHQTLAYFIGRVYLFLTSLGIDKDRLRFRQHLPYEMAHYASDCWDAEIETSCGWIECVGISDRSDFDLRAQSEKSGIALVAQEKYAEPKEVDVTILLSAFKCVIRPNNKELGPAFKSHHKMVVEALKAMTEEKALEMKAGLESKGEFDFEVCKLQKFVTIKRSMVSIVVEKKLEHVRTFTPHVIEASFGIGRILYCLYEHSFYTRFSKTGMRQLNVFRFLPQVAPYKCVVFPLVKNKQYEDVAERITISLKQAGICLMRYTAGTSIKEKYAYADELGVPFAVTVDSETSVTIRERDSEDLIRVNVAEVAAVVKKLSNGDTTWADISQKYSAHTSGIL
ncbi:hypothetical protein CTI12_AA575960 [Artemisia annua]|uniref:glycine--tRNA ligase n=1 Tax=Artemisia annua TaxID=35608 RepID=A0A2U1KR12_ARTAN|nr:hypothetical protein CTI12_AA575960 [Artemisia annua]